MADEIKLCVTCQHFMPRQELGKCARTRVEVPNLVVGGVVTSDDYACSERKHANDECCGPTGKWWEPKEMDTLRICLGLGVYPDTKKED